MVAARCGSCDDGFKRAEKTVACDACRQKFHFTCSKLSETEFELVAAAKCKLKWYCLLCENDVRDILTNLEKFKKMNKELASIKEDVYSKLKEVEKRILQCETKKPAEDVNQLVQERVNKDIQVSREEEKLIESKKCNIIYFKVPESTSDDPGTRMKHDFDLLNKAHKNDFAKHDEIETCFRVGKKSDKARPLIIRFKTCDIKNKFLSKSSDLSLRENNEDIQIFASIDRTPKQRKDHSKLVEELNLRKENGEENLIIRNGKIIENFRKLDPPNRVKWSNLFTA